METVINWNREEKEATLFTYERRVQKHMEQKLGLKPIYTNSSGGKEYSFPKKQVSLPRKPSTHKMTEEQKIQTGIRFANARKNRGKAK
jgi:hypothetical protein